MNNTISNQLFEINSSKVITFAIMSMIELFMLIYITLKGLIVMIAIAGYFYDLFRLFNPHLQELKLKYKIIHLICSYLLFLSLIVSELVKK